MLIKFICSAVINKVINTVIYTVVNTARILKEKVTGVSGDLLYKSY